MLTGYGVCQFVSGVLAIGAALWGKKQEHLFSFLLVFVGSYMKSNVFSANSLSCCLSLLSFLLSLLLFIINVPFFDYS